jgi:uncharacterized protein (DUF2147 family)
LSIVIRLLALALLSLVVRTAHAEPALTGFWFTQDHGGVIAISSCGDMLCARIAGVVLDHPGDPTPLDYRGVSQCALPVITDARQIRPNLWKGHITDPRSGDVYGVELHLDTHGNLALRGFLGFTLLGHTQTWTRYPGTPPADCRLYARNGSGEVKR